MFKNILLALELTHEASWKTALPLAAEMARRDSATLHVLTVAPDFGMTAVAAYFPADFLTTTVRRLKEDLDAFLAAHAPTDVTVEGHVGMGHAAEQIIDASARVKADLIVMASHAPDMMRSLLVGSVADRVVHAAPISVLVVRG